VRHGSDHSTVFDEWWTFARDNYMDLGGDAAPQTVSLYYDPILDVHHKLPVMVAVINALYLAPQRPADAQRLYEAGLGMVGALGDGPPNVIGERNTGVALLLAREWGDELTAARLSAAADDAYEPTWDATRGEFTWGFRLDEEHPRGQFNAIMAAAEAVGAGAWTALTTTSPPTIEGEVVGVDFPTVCLRQAEWVDGTLHVTTSPMNDDLVGTPTSWRVANLDDPSRWTATASGRVAVETRVDGADLVVETIVGSATYRVAPERTS
jgi:hypothetical protein